MNCSEPHFMSIMEMVEDDIPLRLARMFITQSNCDELAIEYLRENYPERYPKPNLFKLKKTEEKSIVRMVVKLKEMVCGKCGNKGHTKARCRGAGNKPRRRGRVARLKEKREHSIH